MSENILIQVDYNGAAAIAGMTQLVSQVTSTVSSINQQFQSLAAVSSVSSQFGALTEQIQSLKAGLTGLGNVPTGGGGLPKTKIDVDQLRASIETIKTTIDTNKQTIAAWSESLTQSGTPIKLVEAEVKKLESGLNSAASRVQGMEDRLAAGISPTNAFGVAVGVLERQLARAVPEANLFAEAEARIGNAALSAAEQTQAAAQATAQTMAQTAQATKFFSQQNAILVGQGLSQVGGALTRNITQPILTFGEDALSESAKFESAMLKVRTYTTSTNEQVNKFQQDVLALSTQVPASAKELADGLFFIASAGFQGADALNILKLSAQASAAGLGETKIVANAVTSVLNAYRLSASEASRVTDLLGNAVAQGKVATDELAPALGRVLPYAKAAGVSFEELTANLATLTRVGLSADKATTALQGTIIGLAAPSKRTKDELARIGLTADDVRASIKDKGLLATLEELQKRTHGNIDELKNLFPNGKALIDILATVGSQSKEYEDILASTGTTTGRTGRAFADAVKTFDVQYKIFENTVTKFKIEVGATILSYLSPVFEYINKIAPQVFKAVSDGFASLSPQIKATILAVAGFVAAIGPVVVTVAGVVIAGTLLAPVLGTIAIAVAVVTGAMIEVVAAGVLLYTAWERDWGGIQQITTDAVNTVLDVFDQIKAWWNDNAPAILAVATNLWKEIDAGMNEVFGAVFEYVRAYSAQVKAVFVAVYDFWKAHKEEITAIATVMYEYIKTIIKAFFDAVAGIFKVAAGVLAGDWRKIWEGLKLIFSAFVVAIESAMKSSLQIIGALINGFFKRIAGVSSDAELSGYTIARGLVNGIISVLTNNSVSTLIVEAVKNLIFGQPLQLELQKNVESAVVAARPNVSKRIGSYFGFGEEDISQGGSQFTEKINNNPVAGESGAGLGGSSASGGSGKKGNKAKKAELTDDEKGKDTELSRVKENKVEANTNGIIDLTTSVENLSDDTQVTRDALRGIVETYLSSNKSSLDAVTANTAALTENSVVTKTQVNDFTKVTNRKLGINSQGNDDRIRLANTIKIALSETKFDEILANAAKKQGVDPLVFRALAATETQIRNITRENKSKAAGLVQEIPETFIRVARTLGYGRESVNPRTGANSRLSDAQVLKLRTNPEISANVGAAYLKQQLDNYNGDYVKAVAAYNSGPGNVNRAIANNRENGIPKFEETQTYVKLIAETVDALQKQKGNAPAGGGGLPTPSADTTIPRNPNAIAVADANAAVSAKTRADLDELDRFAEARQQQKNDGLISETELVNGLLFIEKARNQVKLDEIGYQEQIAKAEAEANFDEKKTEIEKDNAEKKGELDKALAEDKKNKRQNAQAEYNAATNANELNYLQRLQTAQISYSNKITSIEALNNTKREELKRKDDEATVKAKIKVDAELKALTNEEQKQDFDNRAKEIDFLERTNKLTSDEANVRRTILNTEKLVVEQKTLSIALSRIETQLAETTDEDIRQNLILQKQILETKIQTLNLEINETTTNSKEKRAGRRVNEKGEAVDKDGKPLEKNGKTLDEQDKPDNRNPLERASDGLDGLSTRLIKQSQTAQTAGKVYKSVFDSIGSGAASMAKSVTNSLNQQLNAFIQTGKFSLTELRKQISEQLKEKGRAYAIEAVEHALYAVYYSFFNPVKAAREATLAVGLGALAAISYGAGAVTGIGTGGDSSSAASQGRANDNANTRSNVSDASVFNPRDGGSYKFQAEVVLKVENTVRTDEGKIVRSLVTNVDRNGPIRNLFIGSGDPYASY